MSWPFQPLPSGAAALTITAPSFTLTATEAADSASFNATANPFLTLTATDAADTASFNVASRHVVTLTVTEAGDTATFSLDDNTRSLSFTLSDGKQVYSGLILGLPGSVCADTASFSATVGQNSFALTATEAQDVASLNVTSRHVVTLAATDAADTASFNVASRHVVTLTATDAQDSASLNVTSRHVVTLAATEAQDVASLNVAATHVATLIATDTQDTAALDVTSRHGLTLTATEAQDSASLNVSATHVATLTATEATDVASFSAQYGNVTSFSFALSEKSYAPGGLLLALPQSLGEDHASFATEATVVGTTITLAATEPQDSASLSATSRHVLTLAATEAQDTVSLSVTSQHGLTLAATEPVDVLSASAFTASTFSLVATEPADTLSATVFRTATFSLAATEVQDTSNFFIGEGRTFSFAVGETYGAPSGLLLGLTNRVGGDVASFTTATGTTLSLSATEDPDTITSILWSANAPNTYTFALTETADSGDYYVWRGTGTPWADYLCTENGNPLLTEDRVPYVLEYVTEAKTVQFAVTEARDTASLSTFCRSEIVLTATDPIDYGAFQLKPSDAFVTFAPVENTDAASFLLGSQADVTFDVSERPDDLDGFVVLGSGGVEMVATEPSDTAALSLRAYWKKKARVSFDGWVLMDDGSDIWTVVPDGSDPWTRV